MSACSSRSSVSFRWQCCGPTTSAETTLAPKRTMTLALAQVAQELVGQLAVEERHQDGSSAR